MTFLDVEMNAASWSRQIFVSATRLTLASYEKFLFDNLCEQNGLSL